MQRSELNEKRELLNKDTKPKAGSAWIFISVECLFSVECGGERCLGFELE